MKNELFDFISKYIVLTDDEKRVLVELNLFRKHKKGTLLLKEGDISNEYYFVLKGCIRCYSIVDGEEITTDFYTEAESLSPQCIIDKEPSKYNIVCTEDCIISVATPEMETEVFEKFPRFESLCRVLTEELLAKNQKSFADFKSSTPEERYVNLVTSRPNLVQRVPQHQIAS